MVGVVFHEMPKNRTRTNVYHGLGNTFRIFTEAHSQSSAEQYNLHESLLWRWGKLNQEGANVKSSAQEFFCFRNPRPTWVQLQQVEHQVGHPIEIGSRGVIHRAEKRARSHVDEDGRIGIRLVSAHYPHAEAAPAPGVVAVGARCSIEIVDPTEPRVRRHERQVVLPEDLKLGLRRHGRGHNVGEAEHGDERNRDQQDRGDQRGNLDESSPLDLLDRHAAGMLQVPEIAVIPAPDRAVHRIVNFIVPVLRLHVHRERSAREFRHVLNVKGPAPHPVEERLE